MNHGLMNGMFWAGVLFSSIPVIVSIGFALYIWRESRTDPPDARVAAEEGPP